jgi:hypothetical protein
VEITADSSTGSLIESPQFATVRDESQPAETAGGAESGPTDAELERGILDAVSLGLGDVARTLSHRLQARRRGPNVIDLDRERVQRR